MNEVVTIDEGQRMLAPAVSTSMFFDIKKFEHAQRVAKVFASSTMVPEHFRNNIGNILIAMNYADRIGADLFMTMQTMCVIHGKPGIEGKLVISLINNSGRFDPVEFEEVGNLRKPEKDEHGCRAYTMDLKSGKILKGPLVDWAMVKAEGWLDKNGSKWKTMAPLMFRYRAATYFARTYCPEVLLGMQTRDEIQDTITLRPGAGEQYKPSPATTSDVETLAAEFDEAVEGYFGGEESKEIKNEFHLFINKVAQKNSLSVQVAKADVMRENDFDNLVDAFDKQRRPATDTGHREERKSNPPPNAGEKLTDNHPFFRLNWINKRGAGFGTYVSKHAALLSEIPMEVFTELADKWKTIYEENFPYDPDGNLIASDPAKEPPETQSPDQGENVQGRAQGVAENPKNILSSREALELAQLSWKYPTSYAQVVQDRVPESVEQIKEWVGKIEEAKSFTGEQPQDKF